MSNDNTGTILRAVTYIIPAVGIGPTLQKESDCWDGGEHTDRVPANRRRVPGAGQMERGTTATTTGAHRQKLVD